MIHFVYGITAVFFFFFFAWFYILLHGIWKYPTERKIRKFLLYYMKFSAHRIFPSMLILGLTRDLTCLSRDALGLEYKITDTMVVNYIVNSE